MNKIIFTYCSIFLVIVGTHLPNKASESIIDTSFEQLQRTKNVIKGDFENQDLTNFPLTGCSVKSCNFTKALLGSIDPAKTDFYNACFRGAKIDNRDELRDSFPTFNVPGRIENVMDDNECIEGLKVPVSALEHYRSRADAGDPIGLFMTAYLYETYGTREQEEEAWSLYLKAANKGLVEAYNNLGWMCENKRGTSDKSTESAWEYYKKASTHPKGNFNLTRLTALAFKDAPAQYAMGQLYYDGQGVDADPERSFYWYLKSAKQEYSPGMFKVGCFLKSGIGVTPCASKAFEWLLKAASKEYQRAYSQLGLMYYYGEGTPKDLAQSFYYRKKAAAMGDCDAVADIAWMYEKGEGTERNFQKALECYELVAQSTGKISAIYGKAHMCDVLGYHEQAVEFYESTIQQTAQREHHAHANALYRLAIKYEKGLGTAINREKALELFDQAAKTGHIPSQLKVRLMGRASDTTALCSFDDIIAMTPEIQLQYIQESKRVLKEVMHEYKITSNLIFAEDESGISYVVGYGEQVLHAIKQDYLDARRVLKEVTEERKDDPLQINYEFITCDPYIKYYFIDLTKGISDEEITDSALEELFLEMQNAALEITDELNTLKMKFLQDPEQHQVRKRLLARYRIWTSDIHQNRLLVPQEVVNSLRYRQGQAALHFSQNSSRCLDGFDDYLDSLETKDIYGSCLETPLGVRISKVLNQYKEEFLLKHKNSLPNAIEESVEAMRLLRERIRLPLGLPGSFSPVLYPVAGRGNSDLYQPKKVMKRFMKGGTIPERPGIIIESYTPALLVQLLKKAVSKDSSPLGMLHLSLFIEKNEELKVLCEKAVDEGIENDYFDPDAHGLSFYKDTLFIKLLVDHGYILQR